MKNRSFYLILIASAVGIAIGGIGGSYIRGQNINWFFVTLNIALIVMAFYFLLYKRDELKDKNETKIPWAERKKKKK